MKRIEQMYAYVVVDPDDDTEGVPAFYGRDGMAIPMVGADEARMRQLRPMAESMASSLGRPITFVRFEIRTELEVIDP